VEGRKSAVDLLLPSPRELESDESRRPWRTEGAASSSGHNEHRKQRWEYRKEGKNVYKLKTAAVYSPNSFLTRFKTESFDGSGWSGCELKQGRRGGTEKANRRDDPSRESREGRGKLARTSPRLVGSGRRPVERARSA
jgi:hypothetical protein